VFKILKKYALKITFLGSKTYPWITDKFAVPFIQFPTFIINQHFRMISEGTCIWRLQ